MVISSNIRLSRDEGCNLSWLTNADPNSNPETPATPTRRRNHRILRRHSLAVSEEPVRARPKAAGRSQATVITVTADSVFFDIGYKSEGILPLTALRGETLKPGDKALVTVKGRDLDGYYELSLFKVERPMDWTALEKAFADKSSIVGTVTAVVKGGFSVDVGVRAFMPASRSGVRDAAEMEKLVGQEIRCRIIKLDVADEDVVVDRRAVAEEEERCRERSPLLADQRRRHRERHRAQPHRLRRIRRSRGRRCAAACRRHLLGPRQQTGRRALRRPADRSESAQARQRRRQAPHLRRPEATATASLGRRCREISTPATACAAPSHA